MEFSSEIQIQLIKTENFGHETGQKSLHFPQKFIQIGEYGLPWLESDLSDCDPWALWSLWETGL